MVNRTLLAALAVAALVATAGCAGIVGNDNPTDTPNPDDGTDGEPNEPVPSVENFDYPEFATASSLNASEFSSQSLESLNSLDSVTVAYTTSTGSSGNEFSTTRTTAYGNNGSIKTTTTNPSSGVETVSYSPNGNGGFAAVNDSSGDRRYYETRFGERSEYTDAYALGQIAENSDVEAVETTRMNGEPVVTYQFSNFDTEALSGTIAPGAVSDVSASMSMDASGTVHEFTYAFDTQRNGEEFTQSQSASLTEINSTTPTEPDWYSTAESEGVVMDVEFNADGTATVELTQGSLPDGTTAFVATETQFTEVTFDSGLEEGDTRYVSNNADGSVVVSESPPENPSGSVAQMYIAARSDGILIYDNSFPSE